MKGALVFGYLLATGTITSCGGSDSGTDFGDASIKTGGASGGGGGVSTGGNSSGGSNVGGSNSGGTSTGGTSNGGSTGGSTTGGTSSGGDSGTPDASSGGTSAADAGDGAVLTGCAALAECCATVSAPFQPSCNSYVVAGDELSCVTLIPFFCSSADAGKANDAGTSCSALAACCPQLQGTDKTDCEQIVALDFPAACAAALGGYQSSALCN